MKGADHRTEVRIVKCMIGARPGALKDDALAAVLLSMRRLRVKRVRVVLLGLLLVATAAGQAAAQQAGAGGVELPGNTAGSPVGNAAGSYGGNPAVLALQAAMIADPATRERILALQDDPLVAEILADEATMNAIRAGDLGALLANPKLRALAEHPTVRGIVEAQGR